MLISARQSLRRGDSQASLFQIGNYHWSRLKMTAILLWFYSFLKLKKRMILVDLATHLWGRGKIKRLLTIGFLSPLLPICGIVCLERLTCVEKVILGCFGTVWPVCQLLVVISPGSTLPTTALWTQPSDWGWCWFLKSHTPEQILYCKQQFPDVIGCSHCNCWNFGWTCLNA